MPLLVPFCFQTHPLFGLPTPVHLDRFLPARLFQQHQVLQKKAHPGRINPIFFLQLPMLPLFCFCFQDHLFPDLLHVFQMDFVPLVPFLQLASFRHWFRKF